MARQKKSSARAPKRKYTRHSQLGEGLSKEVPQPEPTQTPTPTNCGESSPHTVSSAFDVPAFLRRDAVKPTSFANTIARLKNVANGLERRTESLASDLKPFLAGYVPRSKPTRYDGSAVDGPVISELTAVVNKLVRASEQIEEVLDNLHLSDKPVW